ncbi:hypothetical protein D3C78_1183100 [compost metagenome]
MLIQHPRHQGTFGTGHLCGHTQALQVRLQNPRGLGQAGRVNQPLAIIGLALHEQLGNMLDHVQAFGFNHSPEQILRCQHAKVLGEPAQRQGLGAIECQHASHVGQTAHQVEVEIRLEDRLAGLQVVVAALVGVQTGCAGPQGHTLGHDHQGMWMQTVTGLQQVDPVSLISTCQALV